MYNEYESHTTERIARIADDVMYERQRALDILSGEADNYDGSDGARVVLCLCEYAKELLESMGFGEYIKEIRNE